jgi:hypothetical protein
MDHLELAISGDNYLRISSMLPEFASADKSLLEIFMRSSFPSAGSKGRKQKTHSVFTVQVVKTEEKNTEVGSNQKQHVPAFRGRQLFPRSPH